MTLARLKSPTTLNRAVVEQLREAIITGALAPGAPLRDTEIAVQLGLSSTPVREALVQLAAEGLVEIEPNRLKRVTPIDLTAVVELIEVQNRLWATGYEWGAPKLTPEDIETLRTANTDHRQAIERADVRRAIHAAHAFHLVLMEASGNRELVRVSVERQPLIYRFVLLCAPWIASSETMRHHKTMLARLEQKDAEGALVAFRAASQILLDAARTLCADARG